ncbi:DUF7344 domain-containing protein [Salinigranum halophilum]|jgi:hypothetical protein|uniref:DUF7344 domain-containing protein n=1 Tax=Salinigranum halophilum TaxID=2565931 RepID=UPI0010A8A3BD|nr:hypothetical protein [Salinigranum halophilum]
MTAHDPADVSPSLGPESLTRAFAVLADTRRRAAVRYLHRHPSLSLPTLADGVAEREANAPLRDIDPDEVREVYLSLYHTHVPALEDASVVTYDQECDWVTRRDTCQCELVYAVLESAPSPPDDVRFG